MRFGTSEMATLMQILVYTDTVERLFQDTVKKLGHPGKQDTFGCPKHAVCVH